MTPELATNRSSYPEIDRLKGVAIVFVLLIHPRVFVGHAFHDAIVDRGVPIFLCLFGMTSELWWRGQREDRGFPAITWAWLEMRLPRLILPVWAMLAVWWPMQLMLWPAALHEPKFLIAMAAGYLPWVGAGWFITVILELVLLFPAWRFAWTHLGALIATLVALFVTIASNLWSLRIRDMMRWTLLDSMPFDPYYYFWIFAPAYL